MPEDTSVYPRERRYHPIVVSKVTGFVSHLRARHGKKLIRFGAVSAFNVILGQMLLFGAQTVLGWRPVLANVVSVIVGAVPAYLLSRYWVWEKRGRSHLVGEILPFWTLALVGFALSTAAVWYVDSRWSAPPVVINLTNLTAFGMVWLAKFVVLDRMLFKTDSVPATAGG